MTDHDDDQAAWDEFRRQEREEQIGYLKDPMNWVLVIGFLLFVGIIGAIVGHSGG